MPPGQAVLETTTTAGWFQGADGLRQQLISIGLPNRRALTPAARARPPAAPRPAPAAPAAWPRVAAVLAGLVLLAAAAAVPLRRHPVPGTPAR